MRISYLTSFAIASVLAIGLVSCAGTNEPTSVDSAAESTAVDPCASANPCAGATEVSVFAEDGIAIRGADPVAYFTQGEAVIGSAEFEHEWNGATWRFASAENRDMFASNPEEFAPQYGGYCAWAVSQGTTAPVEPDAWRIVDGKLYLNFDQRVQQRWEQDIEGNIALADENWPGVLAN
ncbi:MAG: YHS domain-containing (seleno)protein [Cyanobacteria bacterium J06633_2]